MYELQNFACDTPERLACNGLTRCGDVLASGTIGYCQVIGAFPTKLDTVYTVLIRTMEMVFVLVWSKHILFQPIAHKEPKESFIMWYEH